MPTTYYLLPYHLLPTTNYLLPTTYSYLLHYGTRQGFLVGRGALPSAAELRASLSKLQNAHSTPASLGGRTASELQQLQGQANHSKYSHRRTGDAGARSLAPTPTPNPNPNPNPNPVPNPVPNQAALVLALCEAAEAALSLSAGEGEVGAALDLAIALAVAVAPALALAPTLLLRSAPPWTRRSGRG